MRVRLPGQRCPTRSRAASARAKAIYVPFTNAIPQTPLLDMDDCVCAASASGPAPTDAVDFSQKPEEVVVEASAVIMATGFEQTPPTPSRSTATAQVPNVITALQMERLLAPHGPYGRVLRPSDGKVPESIAYVQCAGSRDASLGVPYCSRVCCMYAIKQAMLLSGALPLADITIYYMDIRAFGKGYEQFYQNAQAMGIEFVKGKVARITRGRRRQPDRAGRASGGGRRGRRRSARPGRALARACVPACDAGARRHLPSADGRLRPSAPSPS